MPVFVHFNSHHHRANKQDGGDRKALVFRRTKTAPSVKCREIRFSNASGRFVYDPKHPLKCGAAAWVEFDNGTVVPVEPDAGVRCEAGGGCPAGRGRVPLTEETAHVPRKRPRRGRQPAAP